MTAKFKLISIFLLVTCFLNAQSFERDTIYINFNKEIQNCYHKNLKLRQEKEKKIQFNLCGKGILISDKENFKLLNQKSLNKLDFISIENIKDKVLAFREKTYGKYPAKGKAYQAYTKNDLFVTYVIEKLAHNKYALYKAEWREYLFGH